MPRIFLVLPFLLLLFFWAAWERPAGAEGPEFEIALLEYFPHSEEISNPHVVLRIETTRSFPCANYNIPVAVSTGEASLAVELGEPELPPGICLTAIGPATALVEWTAAPGEYTLEVGSAGRIDRYLVTMTLASLSVSPLATTFSQAKFELFYRYPPNSFAYLCGGLLFDDALCNSLASRLTNELPLEEISVPPDGVWPYPRSSEGHYFDAPGRYFRYPDEAVWLSAKEILVQFTNGMDHTCGRGLWLWNWRNDKIMSWLLRYTVCEGILLPTPSPALPSPARLPTTGRRSDDQGFDILPVAMILLGAVVASMVAIRRRG